MLLLVITLSVLSLILVAALFFFITRNKQDDSKASETQALFLSLQNRLDNLTGQLGTSLDGTRSSLIEQLAGMTNQLNTRLNESTNQTQTSTQQVNTRLDNAAKVIGDLQNKLGMLEEANQRIFNVGKDIASLQEILKKPKARGSLGEFFLADLLSEMLPQNSFKLQHRFKNGEIVDAAINVGDYILSIDSKFPLDNFQKIILAPTDAEKIASKKLFVQDVKKHVDAIAKKYIQPEEGTMDFAFLYIMAENVFYELIIKDDDLGQAESLQQYALRKRVIPVSPNSFYAYLGSIMQALRGQKMQENIHDVITQIRQMVIELGKFRDDFDKIGHHLGNLRSSYEASEKRLNRYQEKIEKINALDGHASEPPIKLISGS
ncbi:DNA recombination protein RmuC [bacterium]|nr:DNA recombination protein RmuC [bacterium]